MKKLLNKILWKILLILILIAALFFGGKFSLNKIIEIQTEKKQTLIFRELEQCSELITVKNSYTDIISIKKSRIGGLAKSYSIVKYTGIIRGGISDITKAKVKISNHCKNVEIELPPVEVLSNDIKSIEVFDEEKSVFVSITIKEIMDEIRFNQETTSGQILETGFLDEAKNQSIKIIESIMHAAGFQEVKIHFTDL